MLVPELPTRANQTHAATTLLTLGAYVPSFLAPLSPELRHVWSGMKRLTTVDEKEAALVYPSTFEGAAPPHGGRGVNTSCLPSRECENRRYGNLEGDAAEQALVMDALTRQEDG